MYRLTEDTYKLCLNIYFWLKHNGYVLPGEYEILFVSQQLENILTK